MIVLDANRAASLIELAQKRFDPDLPESELKILRDSASSAPPAWPDQAVPQAEIRPEFVRWLVTDAEAAACIDANGFRGYGVKIAGQLNLDNCRVLVPMRLHGCTLEGEVSFVDAETKSVFFSDCKVNRDFSAWRMDVNGALYFDGTVFNGVIKLMSARIGSTFVCDRAQILVKSGYGLDATGSVFEDGISFGGEFFTSGGIQLIDARLTGVLDCTSAKLHVPEGDALVLTRATVTGGVYLCGGFESWGAIRMQDAEIGGTLSFMGASVAWVLCMNMRLTGDMLWMGVTKSAGTNLDLTAATIKALRDDVLSWPSADNLTLTGFTYGELILHKAPSPEEAKNGWFPQELPLNADARIEWLMRQSREGRIQPQPWMALSAHLQARGDDRAAKHVVYRLRRVQAIEKKTSPLLRGLAIRFAWLEEAPLRILYSITLTLLIGWAIFGYASHKGAIAPTSAEAYRAFMAGKVMPVAYPTFNPFVYTLDNAVPLVKLGQDDKWTPDHRFVSTNPLTSYWFLMWVRWGIILFGWFQATVLAAALSGRFKQ